MDFWSKQFQLVFTSSAALAGGSLTHPMTSALHESHEAMANYTAVLNVSTVLSHSRATTAHLKAQAARDQLHLSEALIKASREPPWGRGGQGWGEDRSSTPATARRSLQDWLYCAEDPGAEDPSQPGPTRKTDDHATVSSAARARPLSTGRGAGRNTTDVVCSPDSAACTTVGSNKLPARPTTACPAPASSARPSSAAPRSALARAGLQSRSDNGALLGPAGLRQGGSSSRFAGVAALMGGGGQRGGGSLVAHAWPKQHGEEEEEEEEEEGDGKEEEEEEKESVDEGSEKEREEEVDGDAPVFLGRTSLQNSTMMGGVGPSSSTYFHLEGIVQPSPSASIVMGSEAVGGSEAAGGKLGGTNRLLAQLGGAGALGRVIKRSPSMDSLRHSVAENGNVLARAAAMRAGSRAPSMSGSSAATPLSQPGIEGAGLSLAPSPPPSKPVFSFSAAGGQGDLRSSSPSLLSPAASMHTSLAGSSQPPSASSSGLISSTTVGGAQRKAWRPALTLTLPDALSLSQAALVSPHRHPLAQTSPSPPAQPHPHQVRPPSSVRTSSDGGWQGRLEGEVHGAGAWSGAEKGREEWSSKPRLSVGGRPGLSRLSQHKANAVMDALIVEEMEEEEARSLRNSNSGGSGRWPNGALLSVAHTRHSVSCSGTGPAPDWGMRPTPPPTPPPPAPQPATSSGMTTGGGTGAVGVAAHRFGTLLSRSSTCKGVEAGDADGAYPDCVGGGGEGGGTGAKLTRSSSCLTLAGMRGGLGGSGKRAAFEAAAKAAVAYIAAAPAVADAIGAAGGNGGPSPIRPWGARSVTRTSSSGTGVGAGAGWGGEGSTLSSPTPPGGSLSPKPPPQPRGGACTTRPARLTDVHGL